MICALDEQKRASLKMIYDCGEEIFHGSSDEENQRRDTWYAVHYEMLGVSKAEWLMFLCDELGIVGVVG